MKTIKYREFTDLNPSEQAGAIEVCLREYLRIASTVPDYFSLVNVPLTMRIKEAIADAEDDMMDWDTTGYIMEYCGDDLMEMAKSQAENYLYESSDQLETIVSYADLREGMGK